MILRGGLHGQHQAELGRILARTRRLDHHTALDDTGTYPVPVQRILKRLARTRADRLLNQVL
jgi:CDP-diacylglycerol--serine O-phosphatidyltransferase